MPGFTLKQATRLNDAIRDSFFSKAEIARRIGVVPDVLNNITGPKALATEDVHRPMLAGDKLAAMCVMINRDINYILDLTDQISPVTEKYTRQFSSLVERMYQELTEQATLRCGMDGVRVNADDILHWWRDTGGEVGRGADIEQYFDVVRMPAANDNYVEPLRIGSKSLAARVLETTDPSQMIRQIRKWPDSFHRSVIDGYLSLSTAENGPAFTGSDVTVKLEGMAEPLHYCTLRLEAKLLGYKSPAAICFAFEWRSP